MADRPPWLTAQHVCSYYCQGPTHAVILLATPDTDPEASCAQMRAYLRAEFGVQVRTAWKPAPEVALAPFAQRHGIVQSSDGRTRDGSGLVPDCTTPYLILITPEEGA